MLKTRRFTIDESDDFTVENDRFFRASGEFLEVGDDFRKLFGFVFRVARDQARRAGCNECNYADTVVFRLECPTLIGRHFFAWGRQHRREGAQEVWRWG